MAVTPADFKLSFPEFAGVIGGVAVDDAYIQVWLDRAARHISPTVWRAKYDDGVLFLAAHWMTVSPQGQGAKLNNADGTSTYGKQYDRLKLEVTGGYRVSVAVFAADGFGGIGFQTLGWRPWGPWF